MATPYWTRGIANAKERKEGGITPFTKENIRQARNWPTCPCGKQDPRIPRFNSGCPIDTELDDFGVQFWEAVINQYPTKAERVMRRIERRAVELIVEFEKKDNQ